MAFTKKNYLEAQDKLEFYLKYCRKHGDINLRRDEIKNIIAVVDTMWDQIVEMAEVIENLSSQIELHDGISEEVKKMALDEKTRLNLGGILSTIKNKEKALRGSYGPDTIGDEKFLNPETPKPINMHGVLNIKYPNSTKEYKIISISSGLNEFGKPVFFIRVDSDPAWAKVVERPMFEVDLYGNFTKCIVPSSRCFNNSDELNQFIREAKIVNGTGE